MQPNTSIAVGIWSCFSVYPVILFTYFLKYVYDVMLWPVFAFTEVLSPVITGLCDDVGTMIYAGSIGTQIANEHIESLRCVCKCFVYVCDNGAKDVLSTAAILQMTNCTPKQRFAIGNVTEYSETLIFFLP